MKTYEGIIAAEGPAAFIIEGDRRRPLPLRLDLRQHSPDGFAWGYLGSGPAQLALALCADVLQDDERAQRIYQIFKVETVAGLRGDRWTLTEDEIRATVERLEREHQLATSSTSSRPGARDPGRNEQPQPEQPAEGGAEGVARAVREAIVKAMRGAGYSDHEQKLAAMLNAFRGGARIAAAQPEKGADAMHHAFAAAMSELCDALKVNPDRIMECAETQLQAATEAAVRNLMGGGKAAA